MSAVLISLIFQLNSPSTKSFNEFAVYFSAPLNQICYSQIKFTNKTEKTLNVFLSKSKKASTCNIIWDKDIQNFSFIREAFILNPQQEQAIQVSFHSKIFGSFKSQIEVFVNEESWKCVDLIAFAFVKDEDIINRESITRNLHQEHMSKFFGEIIDDVLDEVRTSPLPLPDLSIYCVRKTEYANKIRNKKQTVLC